MVSATSLTKRFGNVAAVDNLSLTIEKGDFFALLGPNGAGKTTLVRMLMGFIEPATGSICIDGRPACEPASRRRIGYLAEVARIPPYLSGLEYLRRNAALTGMNRNEIPSEIGRVLDVVGMRGNEQKRSDSYSKGMRQRIGLASALIGRPSLLVLDEPVSGLDPIGIRDVRQILERVNGEGTTIILNSHLLSEAEKSCKTVGIMHRGRVLVKDSLRSVVRENETLEEVFMREVGALP